MAAAQSVEVRVRADSSGRPVPGAIVRLIGADGTVVRQGLASEVGRLVLTPPEAGIYRLRVDAIGYRRTEIEGLAVGAGESLQREVTISKEVTRLPTLVVTATNRCETRFEEGTLAFALWQDVQTALTVVSLTAQGSERLRMTDWERILSTSGAVLEERTTGVRLTSGTPYATISPRALEIGGFVQRLGDSVTYFAPDAALLLSDAFMRTHCFRAVVPKDRTSPLLGLGFQPSGGHQVPDISGVLWVDALSRELRHIEFSYTGLASTERSARPGGRTGFVRLPDGRWIVDDWVIRMPRMELARRPTAEGGQEWTTKLVGYTERGGRVERVAAPPPAITPAVLVGSLWDSLTQAPLAGAMVRVAGVADTAWSDDLGNLRVELPVGGSRLVTVSHPKLGLVSDRSVQAVTLVPGQETRIEVAVPSVAAFRGLFCSPAEAGNAGLLGIAYLGGVPTEDMTVRVTWLAQTGARTLQYR
ncbi:MAG: hypothetical protein H6R40_1269 [Gemmatimonadetes bacterium]|nr:hypothetical protein [Gemmatimonadota bacterium]